MRAIAYRFVADGPEFPHSPFPTGGGAMGALVRALDWSLTPLGAIGGWPPSLRSTVNLVLDSPLAMTVLWGPNLVQVYNDAFAIISGLRHPRAGAGDARLLARGVGIQRADLCGGAGG